MATLDQAVKQGLATIAGSSEAEKAVYFSTAWQNQRTKYQGFRSWYDGDEWKKFVEDLRDPASGERLLQWPLRLNPVAKVCRVHRAVMLGMQENQIKGLPVETMAIRDESFDEGMREEVEHAQGFVNRVWYSSHGVSAQFESCLLLQIYGGHVFKVSWCPWETAWPSRIGIRSLKTPEFFYPAVFDAFDPWKLHEAYIGYMISAEEAKAVYGIIPADGADEALYLERWTLTEYTITVDGRVPTMEWNGKTFLLAGENPWGIVPIVYIPHDPDGAYFGRSMVDGESSLVGLAKELNARMADKGDAVLDSRPLLAGRNLRAAGRFKMRDVTKGGRVVAQILDIGDAKPLPGSREPDVFVVQPAGMPKAEAAYTEDVWTEIYRQADIARVATGDDDVSGGRITGPVTAYRMWPTMQHTMAERAYYSDGIALIAKVILVIAAEREKSGAYKELGLPAPGITDNMLALQWGSSWRPMIPIEASQQVTTLNSRLKESGISLHAYLTLIGVQDVDAEIERIWADRERQMELDAKLEEAKAKAAAESRPQSFGGGGQ